MLEVCRSNAIVQSFHALIVGIYIYKWVVLVQIVIGISLHVFDTLRALFRSMPIQCTPMCLNFAAMEENFAIYIQQVFCVSSAVIYYKLWLVRGKFRSEDFCFWTTVRKGFINGIVEFRTLRSEHAELQEILQTLAGTYIDMLENDFVFFRSAVVLGCGYIDGGPDDAACMLRSFTVLPSGVIGFQKLIKVC